MLRGNQQQLLAIKYQLACLAHNYHQHKLRELLNCILIAGLLLLSCQALWKDESNNFAKDLFKTIILLFTSLISLGLVTYILLRINSHKHELEFTSLYCTDPYKLRLFCSREQLPFEENLAEMRKVLIQRYQQIAKVLSIKLELMQQAAKARALPHKYIEQPLEMFLLADGNHDILRHIFSYLDEDLAKEIQHNYRSPSQYLQ